MAEPSKGESIATLEDFRRFGGEFGIKTAKRAMEDLARQDVKTWWQHFTTVVFAEKEVHLRAIGATDEEIQNRFQPLGPARRAQAGGLLKAEDDEVT